MKSKEAIIKRPTTLIILGLMLNFKKIVLLEIKITNTTVKFLYLASMPNKKPNNFTMIAVRNL